MASTSCSAAAGTRRSPRPAWASTTHVPDLTRRPATGERLRYGSTYPLAEVAEAMRHLELGHAEGKIVITV
jgi:NADPH:quinone reductase-like Zn-dependent oxidoreductase